MPQAETLARVLVQAFKDRDPGLHSLLYDVADSDIEELVQELRTRAMRDDPGDVSALANFLLSQTRTRGPAVLLCLRLIQARTISDRTAFRWKPAIRAAFIDSLPQNGVKRQSDSTTQSVHPASLFQSACDIILSFLTGPSGENLDECGQAGHAQAMEFLPTVLECLSSEALFLQLTPHKRNRASPTNWTAENVIKHIIAADWPSQMILPVLNVLGDADLGVSQQEQACRKVVSGLTNVPEAHISGLVQCALSAAGKFETVCWMNTVRKLLNVAPSSSLRDIFCIIEISLQHGSAQLELLLEVFSTAAGSTDTSITACDITLLLLIAQNDLCRFTVMDTLTNVLVEMCQPQKGGKAEPQQMRAAQGLISAVCQRSEAVWQCSLLLELGISLVEPHRAGGQALGAHLLSELFHWQPHSRAELIQTSFNALVEHSQSRDTQALFLALLRQIASTHLLALRDQVQALGYGLAQLWLALPVVAKPVLEAFVPVCKHSRALADKLLVMFRKEMYAADNARATLAVFGQCHLLASGVLASEQEQMDALVALRPVFSASLSVRAELYRGVLSVLRSSEEMKSGAVQLLQQMLLRNINACMRPVEGGTATASCQSELRLLRCFEHRRFNSVSTLRVKENLTGLFECVGGLAGRDELAAKCMTELCAQLTDAGCVLEMLTGEGRGADAEECDACKVATADRAALLLPLYEVFVAYAAQNPLPPWVVPPAMQGSGKGARAAVSGESVQAVWLHLFSTVTALFPASPLQNGDDGPHEASHVSPDDALVTLERLCCCGPEQVRVGGTDVDPEASRVRKGGSNQGLSREDLKRLAPVVSRMVRRAVSQSERGLHGLIQSTHDSGEGSVASGSQRAREEGAQRDKTLRLVACLASLLRASESSADACQSGHSEKEERESAAGCAEGGEAETEPEREDGKDALREDGGEAIAEEVDRGSRSIALDGAAEELVTSFQCTLRMSEYASQGVGGSEGQRRSLPRLRNVVLQGLVDCVRSAEGAAVCRVLLSRLADSCPRHTEAEAGVDRGRHGKGKAAGRDDGKEEERRRVELAMLMLERLSREAEDAGVHLTALLLGLDFVAAVWSVGGDRRGWHSVCRAMIRLLFRLNVTHSRAWKRALSFTFGAIATVPATMLACRLLSSVAAEPEAQNAADGGGGWDLGLLPELVRDTVKGVWSRLDAWELPVLSESTAVSAVIAVCLHSLLPLFSSPPDWAVLAGRGSADDRERLACAVQAVVSCSASFGAAREVTSSTRSAMLRASRLSASLAMQVVASRSARDWEEDGLEVVVALVRAALGGAEELETVLATVQAEAAARCRFMAEKLRVRVAKACAALERGNEESAAVAELRKLATARSHSRGMEGEREGEEGGGEEELEGGEDGESRSVRAGKKRKRRGKRMRSSNAYVDAFLEEEDGGDSFADLEDFIVCKKGARY